MNNSNGEGQIPAWMKTVDKDTLYNAKSSDATKEATSSTSPAPTDPATASESSSLSRKLALSMADPSDIPTPDPALQPMPVGHVRADLEKQIEKAVSVLSSRYETDLPRSLLLEYSLQRTLLQLREQGEECDLVQWLDAKLARH